MGRTIPLLLLLQPLFVLAQQGSWSPRSGLVSGLPRWGSVEFVINGTAYMVGGRTSNGDVNEVWAYDPLADTWQQRAPIPGVRRLAAAFAIQGKGYVACGLQATSSMYNDLWEYDPLANTWNQRASLPASARYACTGFAIGNTGYVFGGNSGGANGPYNNELWAYDPATDIWSARASLPDLARMAMRSFVAGGLGHIVGGRLSDQTFSNTLWAYDPVSNTWSSRAALPASTRSYPFVWSAYGRGLLCGGDDLGFSSLRDCWAYTPSSNAWTALTDYAGLAIWGGAAFAINDRVFAGMGRYGADIAGDLWELTDLFVGMPERTEGEVLTVAPNPCRVGDAIRLTLDKGAVELSLMDASGRVVLREYVRSAGPMMLPLDHVTPGAHQLVVRHGDGRMQRASLVVIP